jgi:hypothetical protein
MMQAGKRIRAGFMLKRRARCIAICRIALLSCLIGTLSASPPDLEQAAKAYHSGDSDAAIAILKPLALQGDLQAQNLLGNIIYGLSIANPSKTGEDPKKWYQMASAQGSPEASYALGAIHDNHWLRTTRKEDALLAEHYYQQALDRGYRKAEAPLMRIAAHNQATRQSDSLKYSDSSFSKQRRSQDKPDQDKVDRDLLEVLPQGGFAGMEMTGDPIADAAQLEALLQRLNAIAGGIDLSQINSGGPDEAMLTAMLLNFGVSEDQAANLAKLLRQFMSTEKTDSATGWN